MINLGTIQMPLNSATKTFAFLGKRGSGKTYAGAVMAEEFFKNNIPFVAIDPIDVWFGLRLDKNGKDKGLPIVVFGKEHADIIIDRDDGRKIAQAIVKENISCVISTFGMSKKAYRYLLTEFAEELLRINNTPRHIFIEEAHEFVPQRVMGGMGTVFSAIEALVVMGRNKGIGVTLLNQRAATVNKDVLTQIDTLVAMRSVGPQDRKALREWVEFHAAEGDFEKFIESLPSLPTGEAWIWSPEFLNIFEKIKFRKRTTFHPDREKLGDNFVMPELSQIDIQSFIQKFNKKEERIIQGASLKMSKVSYYDEKKEQAEKQELVNLKNDYESKLVEKDLIIQETKKEVNRLNSVLDRIRGLVANDISIGKSPIDTVNLSETNAMLEKLGGMPKRIYERLLQHPSGLTKRQIALMCGYSVTSGSYSNSLSKLKTMGLISRNGEIYQALTK